MKERKYKDDWVNETRLNEKTGRPKVVPVYRGPWFERKEGAGKNTLLLYAGLPLLGVLILLLLYLRLGFPGVTTLYVFLPAALALFPALYWLLGIWGIFRSPERMTRLQKENGIGRVLRSSAACMILTGCAVIGDIILLLSGGKTGPEWPGSLMLAGACTVSIFAFRYFRAVYNTLSEKENSAK